jgi:hypothetical protein
LLVEVVAAVAALFFGLPLFLGFGGRVEELLLISGVLEMHLFLPCFGVELKPFFNFWVFLTSFG